MSAIMFVEYKDTTSIPPYDPAIPLLGMYPEETKIVKDTCTPLFIAALFTIARTWKQPRCPSTDEWIKNLWHIYTMDYYLPIKRDTFEFPEPYSKFPLAIYFTYSNVSFHVILSIHLTLSPNKSILYVCFSAVAL